MAITEKYVSPTGSGAHDGSTAGNAWTWAEMLTNVAAGNRANVIVGAYSLGTSTTAFTNVGTATNPIIVRGYSSTIGDGYLGRTNGNGALITTNMPFLSLSTGRVTLPVFTLFESINIQGASTVSGELICGVNCSVRGCYVAYTGTGAISCLVSASNCVIDNNDIVMVGATGGTAGITVAAATKAIANRVTVTSSSASCILSSGAVSPFIAFNTCKGGIGISNNNTGAIMTILYNTIVSSGGDGINVLTGTTNLQCIYGNMITDCTGDGVDMVSTANAAYLGYNRFRDNANSYANAGDWLTATKYGDVDSGTTGAPSDDYVNPGTDYTLLLGSASTNAGNPPYMSIGALQRQSVAGGGQTSRIFG